MKTFSESERMCQMAFDSCGNVWHGYTSGKEQHCLQQQKRVCGRPWSHAVFISMGSGQVIDGYIAPPSFCDIRLGMAILLQKVRDQYRVASFRDLSKAQRLDLARTLHYDYRSSNGQIRRVLGLTQYEVDSLFPMGK